MLYPYDWSHIVPLLPHPCSLIPRHPLGDGRRHDSEGDPLQSQLGCGCQDHGHLRQWDGLLLQSLLSGGPVSRGALSGYLVHGLCLLQPGSGVCCGWLLRPEGADWGGHVQPAVWTVCHEPQWYYRWSNIRYGCSWGLGYTAPILYLWLIKHYILKQLVMNYECLGYEVVMNVSVVNVVVIVSVMKWLWMWLWMLGCLIFCFLIPVQWVN